MKNYVYLDQVTLTSNDVNNEFLKMNLLYDIYL